MVEKKELPNIFVYQSIEGSRRNELLNAQILGVDKVPAMILAGVTKIEIPYEDAPDGIAEISFEELMDLVKKKVRK